MAAIHPKKPLPKTGRLKIILLMIAFTIAAFTFYYTHTLVQSLQHKEQEVANLYAESIEFIAADGNTGGDVSFIFEKIIRTIDFPLILSDPQGEPLHPYVTSSRNTGLDTSLSIAQQREFLLNFIHEIDGIHRPIAITFQDTIVLNYVHYGESPLVKSLRMLPFIEFTIVALFIFVGYVSFSYIKRTEQSNIWVGMARETAHQLGTPLSSMMGWIELLREQAGEIPALRETLHDMENDLRRLQKIADRFSKIGSQPDLREENLNETIQHTFEYFHRRIPRTGKRVTLHLNARDQVFARINSELFEWVLENLIKNALDAMGDAEGTISLSLTREGGEAVIDVTDTGKGVDTLFRKDIFRPGFSTKQRGWGLGLSLSKRIIESYHKGRLTLKESTPGKGTTFRIRMRAV